MRLARSGGPCGPGSPVPGLLGRLLDRRVADRRPGRPALGSAGGASGGFWCGGRRAERAQQLRKPAVHPIGRESRLGSGPLPRQSGVGGDRAGQAQLGVGDQHQPGPPVGLGGMAGPWGGPAEGLLGEPDGVFQVEPADLGPPGQVQVELAGAGPPPPQHLGWAGAGRDSLDLDTEDGAAHDRSGSSAAVAGVALLFGMQPAPGRHGHAAVLVVLTSQGGGGVGQVVGSAKLNLAPWRRGRPPLGERAAGGGSA